MVSTMPNLRRAFVFLVGIAILIVAIPQIEKIAGNRDVLKPYDFVEYWSAGRQLLDGRDPYDPDQLVLVQRSMDEGIRKTVMMWNPPWTLPLTLPFAALPWRLAQFVWLGLQLASVLLSADLLWRIYDGDERHRWVAWLVALTFAPTLFLLLMGQISGFLLLGVVGFVFLLRRERPYLAGCCAALTAIKPHLFLPVALLLLLDATHRPAIRRAVMAGGCLLVVASLLPLLWNSHVWEQYIEATKRPPSENFDSMQQFEQPTLGYQLRLLIPGEPFAAEFVPSALVLLAVVVYWLRYRNNWLWENGLPVLILLSVLSAAYGAWAFDLVVLLIPLIGMAEAVSRFRHRWSIAAIALLFLVLNALVIATVRRAGSQSNPLIAPVVFAGYFAVVSLKRFVK